MLKKEPNRQKKTFKYGEMSSNAFPSAPVSLNWEDLVVFGVQQCQSADCGTSGEDLLRRVDPAAAALLPLLRPHISAAAAGSPQW